MTVTIALEDNPAPEDVRSVREGLRWFNRQFTADDSYAPVTIFLRDENSTVCGGLLGETYWGWLHVDILWVDESRRGQGYGKQLLQMAEDEGRRRGCKNAHLDTMSFQALDFYQRQGYTVWGRLEDIPAGHDRIYLRKGLA